MPPASYPYYEWSLSSSSDARTFGVEPPSPYMALAPDDYATLQQQKQQLHFSSSDRSHITTTSTTSKASSLEDQYYVRQSVLPSHTLTSCLKLFVHRLVKPRYVDLCKFNSVNNNRDDNDDDSNVSPFISDKGTIEEGENELRVTAGIYGMGIPLHGTNTPSSTVVCHKIPEHQRRVGILTKERFSRHQQTTFKPPPLPSVTLSGDKSHHDLYWEEELSFPVRYKDTFRDSCIVIDVIGPCGKQIYGTTLPLYNRSGKLRMGKYKLRLFRGKKGHPCIGRSYNATSTMGCPTLGLLSRNEHCLCITNEERNLVKASEEGEENKDTNDYLWQAERTLDDIQQRRQWLHSQEKWQEEQLSFSNHKNNSNTRPRASWVTSATATGTPIKQQQEKSPSKTTAQQKSSATTSFSSKEKELSSSSSSTTYWLDNLMEQRCLDILGGRDDKSSLSFDGNAQRHDNNDTYMPTLNEEQEEDLYFSSLDHSSEEYIQATEAYLIVELPTFPICVVHEELLYGPPIHGSSGSVTALDLSLYKQRKEVLNLLTKQQQEQEKRRKQQQQSGGTGIGVTNNVGNDGSTSTTPVAFPGSIVSTTSTPQLELLRSKILEQEEEGGMINLIELLDYENIDDNPVEDLYRMMSHDLLRGIVDPSIKPNKVQRAKINSIINSPTNYLTIEEKDLLWKFRFSLVDNNKALTKFLLAVEWNEEIEVVQVVELLNQWKKRSPITVTDALKLLGKDVAFQTNLVRGYAIDTLAEAPDEELQLYLLQLVQALKYEDITLDDMIGRGGIPLNKDSMKGTNISTTARNKREHGTSLANFLIERASKNIILANFLYWYLKVEIDQEDKHCDRYTIVFNNLRKSLSKIHNYRTLTMWDRLALQDKYMTNLMTCQMLGREERGRKDIKERKLKSLINERLLQRVVKDDGTANISIPLPSEPHIMINGIEESSIFMFKSAMYPAVMEFVVEQQDSTLFRSVASELFLKRTFAALDNSHDLQEEEGENEEVDAAFLGGQQHNATTNSTVGSTYKVILKTGDDLRQDQLVMMLIKLMDGLLKKGTLNLCLRPYSIIATSTTSGLVEFVSGSIPISQILSNYNNSILQYFQTVAPIQKSKNITSPSTKKTFDIRTTPSASVSKTIPSSSSTSAAKTTTSISAATATGQTSSTSMNAAASASNISVNKHDPSSSSTPALTMNSKSNSTGVQLDVMNTYIRSCAGYCVITYLLGVGDRHLDNIMLLPTGHLFHIDFGYIFGRDPKPLPPPFRLTREMVDGMGGVDSAGYKKFCALSCQAFNILRKHAGLVLNLLHLMSDAGIEDLSNNPTCDSEGIIQKVSERFRLELTEEQAEQFFTSLIKESLDAFAPRVMEVFHQISVARR